MLVDNEKIVSNLQGLNLEKDNELENSWLWLDGEFVSWKAARMHVLSHHYGVGVFEGVRAYETAEGCAIFRLQDHTERLFNSAHILNMKIPYDRNMVNQIQRELLKRNHYQNAYLRPMVFYGGEYLGMHTHTLSVHMMIGSIPWQGAYFGAEKKARGITMRTSSFIRNHPNSVFSKSKANGNYMNSILAMQEAQQSGADDALILDHQGCIAEATGANIFIVRNNVLYTPNLMNIFEGITRDTIFTIAQDLGLTVIEKHITRDEAYIADEAFVTGTAVEVTPIYSLDNRVIGTGEKGKITQQLQQAYREIVCAKDERYHEWLTLI